MNLLKNETLKIEYISIEGNEIPQLVPIRFAWNKNSDAQDIAFVPLNLDVIDETIRRLRLLLSQDEGFVLEVWDNYNEDSDTWVIFRKDVDGFLKIEITVEGSLEKTYQFLVDHEYTIDKISLSLFKIVNFPFLIKDKEPNYSDCLDRAAAYKVTLIEPLKYFSDSIRCIVETYRQNLPYELKAKDLTLDELY